MSSPSFGGDGTHDDAFFYSNGACRYHPRVPVGLTPRDRTPLVGVAYSGSQSKESFVGGQTWQPWKFKTAAQRAQMQNGENDFLRIRG